MRKYIIVAIIMALLVMGSILKIQSRTETQYKNMKQFVTLTTNKNDTLCNVQSEQEKINQDILNVQEITGWGKEISTYFVNEANKNSVLIYEEALPLACIETGSTYNFNAIHINTNGSTDIGLFQINTITYNGVIKQFQAEGRQFDTWEGTNPELNISVGLYWIGFLKNTYGLEGHQLFTSYNKGVAGAKNYASKYGTYESDYSRKVFAIRNELIKYKK